MKLAELKEQLNKLTSLRAKRDFCIDNLDFLGKGSARRVFKVNHKYVIKVARNGKGKLQNDVERNLQDNEFYKDFHIINKVIYSNDNTYLILKKATLLTEAKFEEIFGISFFHFSKYLSYLIYKRIGKQEEMKKIQKDYPFVKKYIKHNKAHTDKFKKLLDDCTLLFDKSGLRPNDARKISSWGLIDNKIMLLDYGMDDEVKKVYDKEKKEREAA